MDTFERRDVAPLVLGGVPELRTVYDRPELGTVADDRVHVPTEIDG